MITKTTHEFKGPQYATNSSWICWAGTVRISWFGEEPQIGLAGRSFNNAYIGVKLL